MTKLTRSGDRGRALIVGLRVLEAREGARRSGLVRALRRGRENTLHLTPERLPGSCFVGFAVPPIWTERLDRLEAFFTQDKENP